MAKKTQWDSWPDVPLQRDAVLLDSGCPVQCGCEGEWVECGMCEEGTFDAYEDDPLWYSPGDREVCPQCNGKGGWNVCVNAKSEED